MMKQQELMMVGRLGAPHGIRGWMKVNPFTEDREGIFEYRPWLVTRGGVQQEMKVLDWRRQNNGLIVRLDGVEDRDAAAAYTNCDISISADQLAELPEDEFYWRDLIGCKVVNTQGYDMGTVSGVLETGANDVLEIKANPKDAFGKRERMVPFVPEQFILEVNKSDKLITVDWDPSF
ncbi:MULTISPECIES: ribosome maturation factor RimM [unclassified Ferrimonas]|uniref:ribosome maturation factor RimM n=1 Tax=unclassified Ferrimonas TaxID=2620587 RepID=UPI0025743DCE|nr:ribosome maturation factor RimM [Ferrimonas sp. YFM]